MRTRPEGTRLRGFLGAATLAFLALLPCPAARAEDVVSFARPVARTAPVAGSLVSLFGSVTLSGAVERDLVVVGGDVVLAPGARVAGDVLVVGGRLRSTGDVRAYVGGEVRTVEALEAAFLAELETSPASGRSLGLLFSLRITLLALWLVAGALLLFLAPRRVGSAAAGLPGSAPLDALLGAVALLSGALLSTFLFAALPARAALAGTALVLVALLAAKVFGLAVLFLSVGRRLNAGASRRSALWGDPAALACGLLALGAVSLLPWAGRILWMAASLVAIGLSIGTAFGGRTVEDLTLSARRA